MMTVAQITRWIEANQFTTAAGRLLANGRCHSPTARMRLLDPLAVKPTALGLSLQRICELNYWAGVDATQVASVLVRMQRADGLFGPVNAAARSVIAASAVSLRGLIEWRAQAASDDPLKAEVTEAIDYGWAGLARMIAAELGRRSLANAVLTDWSIVLWQLGDTDEARSRMPIDRMAGALRLAGASTKTDDLPRLAMMLAA